MNCEHVEELLSAYLDKQLVTPEQQAIANHLNTCTECNHTLSDFRLFDSLLSRLPRITPDQSLQERIFSSREYKELTGSLNKVYSLDDSTTPHRSTQYFVSKHPHLTPLPGGRRKKRRTQQPSRGWIHYTRILIVLIFLLTLGIAGFIAWNLLQRSNQPQPRMDTEDMRQSIKPQQTPLPAGTRFVFLRDGALWSEPIDGEKNIAGDMRAYIDLQTGRLHIMRSNDQDDSIVLEPPLKPSTLPSLTYTQAKIHSSIPT
jgi:hypothetical protein